MRLTAGCQLSYEAQALAPLILMLRPQSGASQTVIQADLQFNPHLKATEYFDIYGNACHRLLMPPGELQITSQVTADTSDMIDVNSNADFVPVQSLPDQVLHFLLPSRYCQSDLLGRVGPVTLSRASSQAMTKSVPFAVGFTTTLTIGTTPAMPPPRPLTPSKPARGSAVILSTWAWPFAAA
jgi:hypothetical protein